MDFYSSGGYFGGIRLFPPVPENGSRASAQQGVVLAEAAKSPVAATDNEVVTSDHKNLGRPAAASSAETRQRIIQAARQCFSADGYDATTNWNVANTAGITPRALYHYFESKRALFIAAYEDTYGEFFTHLAGALQGSVPMPTMGLEDWFSNAIDAVFDFAVRDKTIGAFMAVAPIDIARSPNLEGLPYDPQDSMWNFVAAMVDNLAADGRLHPDADPAAVSHLIASVLVGLNLTINVFHIGEPKKLAEALKLLAKGSLFDMANRKDPA